MLSTLGQHPRTRVADELPILDSRLEHHSQHAERRPNGRYWPSLLHVDRRQGSARTVTDLLWQLTAGVAHATGQAVGLDVPLRLAQSVPSQFFYEHGHVSSPDLGSGAVPRCAVGFMVEAMRHGLSGAGTLGRPNLLVGQSEWNPAGDRRRSGVGRRDDRSSGEAVFLPVESAGRRLT